MGIVHFAPIGTNPGAVTAALSYLKHDEERFTGYGPIVESVVLFASHDVVEGETTIDECVFNEYGSLQARHTWRRKDRPNIIGIVQQFIQEELAPIMPGKGKIYLWPVNPKSFDNCFDALVEATLTLGRPEAKGHFIWANLTGGTNILNAALLEVAFLSGLIGRIYYTFIPHEGDRKYLQPPSRDPTRFQWEWVPMIKTVFDDAYYQMHGANECSLSPSLGHLLELGVRVH